MMNIELKHSNYFGTELVFTAENVKIEESLSEAIYAPKEDGSKGLGKRLGTDITDENIEMFTTIMDDIAYYRDKPYDFTDLIKRLFDKMPDDKVESLVEEIKNEYCEYFED